MHVIGLDVGTTGVKACVFDADGAVKGYAFREYGVICDAPGMGEQNAAGVWESTTTVIAEAVRKAGVADIKALSVSVQGDAIIAIDKSHNPLYNAILGMDYRSEKQARYCSKRFGERALFDRTGMRPHPMNSLVKMLWLRENHPEVWGHAWKVVTYADFVSAKLCGTPVIDFTMASRTMGFDLARRAWAEDLLGDLDIDPGLLCTPVASGSVVGTIEPALASRLGLPAGVSVVAGGHDQTCAALGAGVITGRRAVVSSGTAEVLSTTFAERPSGDVMFESYYPCYVHTVPGMLFSFALNHSGGILFRWYRDNLAAPEVAAATQAGTDPYSGIVAGMPRGLSPVMVLPHFNGSGTPTCDIHSKGAIVGMTLATTRHDIAKAVIEALSFELRINCARLRETGLRHDELVVVGGGAKSTDWLQLRADILGCTVRTLAVREAACLGAALLAGTAVGMYGSLEEGVGRTVRTKHVYEPHEPTRKLYDERFGVYEKLYSSLRTINHKM